MNIQATKTEPAQRLSILGGVYALIGISPLFLFKEIIGGEKVDELLVVGSLSCIVWTLILVTTILYVIILFRADNRGEGGILALYNLVRRRKKWLVLLAIVGGAALIADGIVIPAFTVTTAVEGIKNVKWISHLTSNVVVILSITILILLFITQHFITTYGGKVFGIIMSLWFGGIATLGIIHITDDLQILKALNPIFAFRFINEHPKGIWLLGSIVLCVSGSEMLYGKIGHYGKRSIRQHWIFVKICLVVFYFGQAAHLLKNYGGTTLLQRSSNAENLINPFYALVPSSLIIVAVLISITVAIIASNSIINWLYSLVDDAKSTRLWPKVKIDYPSKVKGEIYISSINVLILVGSCMVVLIFQSSSKIVLLYGLGTTLSMGATVILFANYLTLYRIRSLLIYLFLIFYFLICFYFLMGIFSKLYAGGYFVMILNGVFIAVMYIWYKSRRIRNRFIEFVRFEHYIPKITELSRDTNVTKFASNVVFLTAGNNPKEIEYQIIRSIFNNKLKRADLYWFLHVDILDASFASEYAVTHIVPNNIIRIDFRLGFRNRIMLDYMFETVVSELLKIKEINTAREHSISEWDKNKLKDIQFIVVEESLLQFYKLTWSEDLILKVYYWIKGRTLSIIKTYELDGNKVITERYPLIVSDYGTDLKLKRVEP